MQITNNVRLGLLLAASVGLFACSEPSSVSQQSSSKVAVATDATSASAVAPQMVVYKSASCGCCGSWVEHMRDAGFAVDVRDEENLNPIKERLGVPHGKGSCHTAQVGGYFVEGHVPAADIRKLLAERPNALGLVLPGMPAGSPGMEMPDGRVESYTVELVGHDGSTTPYQIHAEVSPPSR